MSRKLLDRSIFMGAVYISDIIFVCFFISSFILSMVWSCLRGLKFNENFKINSTLENWYLMQMVFVHI